MPRQDVYRAAVAEFVKAAIKKAGKGEELARLLTPELGKRPSRATVYAWAEGARQPSAYQLLAIGQVTGLSLDAALGRGETFDEQQRYGQRLAVLEEEFRRRFGGSGSI